MWVSPLRYAKLLRYERLEAKGQPVRLNTDYDQAISWTGMVAMRMGYRNNSMVWKFQYIDAVKIMGSVPLEYAIFVIHKGQVSVFRDNADMFPSDDLITKLKVLETL